MIKPVLTEIVRELLRTRPRAMTYLDIFTHTGITEAWLKAFAAGRAGKPSADRIETLYSYLTGNTLNV